MSIYRTKWIPIKSSLFGCWYLNYALVILEIGTYIRRILESKIKEMSEDKCLIEWKRTSGVGINSDETKREKKLVLSSVDFFGTICHNFDNRFLFLNRTTASSQWWARILCAFGNKFLVIICKSVRIRLVWKKLSRYRFQM